MKTTIEIADDLMHRAKELAAKEGTTLRALVEEGLRAVVQERRRASPFRLRDASFQGEGLQPGVREASWDQLRDLAYEDHGA